MKHLISIILVLLLCVGGYSAIAAEESEDELTREAIELGRDQLQLDREKWEYEKAQKEKEEFERQLPNGFDYKRGVPTYELIGYVSDAERQQLLKAMTILEEMGQSKIRINISSFGGSAFDGMGVADTLESFKKRGFEIICYCYGKIASAAVPIFASGSIRIAGASTVFMVHEASIFKFFASESKSDIESQKEMMDKLESRYIDMLVRNSKMPSDFWARLIKRETWFTSDQAMEWGLVDKIE